MSGLSVECGDRTTTEALPWSDRCNFLDLFPSVVRETLDGFHAHLENDIDAEGIVRVHEGVKGRRMELFQWPGGVSEGVGPFFHRVLEGLQGREHLGLVLMYSDPSPNFGLRVLMTEPFSRCGKGRALTRSEVNTVRSLAPMVGSAMVANLRHSLSW